MLIPLDRWRKNGKKLSKRKLIREEARRRMRQEPLNYNVRQVYDWVHHKIRSFYDIAPLSVVWPLIRKD